MANVLFCDSFSHYNTGGLALKYPTIFTGAIIPGGGRTPGSSCLRGNVRRPFGAPLPPIPPPQSVCTVEVAVKFPARPTTAADDIILLADDVNPKVFVGISTAGEVRVKWGSGGSAASSGLGLLANTWYHIGIQAKIHGSTGFYTVRVRGGAGEIYAAQQLNINTSGGTGDNLVHSFGLLQPLPDAMDFSDLVVSADQFAGDCTVKVLYPDQLVHNGWTPNTGTALECVDDPQLDGDTTYVFAADAGSVVSFGFQPLGLPGAVRAVQHVSTLRTDAGDPRTVRQYVLSGATLLGGEALSPPSTYQMFPRCMQVNPVTGLRWTIAEVDALIAGVALEV